MTRKCSVLELRVAITTADYERLVKFYCDGLDIQPAAVWETGETKGRMLEMGRATLEIFDEAQAEMVDRLEAGERVSGHVRLALQVSDLQCAMEGLVANGATLVHPPVLTPWGDYNVRLRDPDGLQITLYQPVGEGEID